MIDEQDQGAELSAELIAHIKKHNDMVIGTALSMSIDYHIQQLLDHITYLNRQLAEVGAQVEGYRKIVHDDNALLEKEIADLQAENERLREALEVAR